MRILALCAVISVLALGLMGCGQAEQTQEQAEQPAETMEETVEGAVTEAPMVDPVCGVEVTAESEWTAEYGDVTFYFCCEECRDKFLEDPGKYLEEMGEEVVPT